ncbi:Lrp/AsnC family transcriptional regulator [Calditerricola satsumensis]|uniref:Putative HTH-type transcriptional regulator YugG n=1 Tax=Calditerricola satsumensis TaxID=373054 RepID=A0A8J3B6B2_9BACI|nr:Lrp/AsnC family transcriptional regulator [Calditerricola satsumensis]GGJ98577.1 putative HTH-type transcriptional regulator YugG [Calditerricola satsumensis]
MSPEKTRELLRLLEANCRRSPEALAVLLDVSVDEVNEALRRLEEQGIIVKYSALVNWDKVQEDRVTAMIDVKVTPKRDVGFDEVAQRISQFPEVTALYLMSGAYDLSVVVEGRSMKEIAAFVSEKLATLDSVISTTTHFIMKKYKHDGVIFDERRDDRRMVVTP